MPDLSDALLSVNMYVQPIPGKIGRNGGAGVGLFAQTSVWIYTRTPPAVFET